MKIYTRFKGMNLIELLVTLAIVSLLLSFAYTSYHTHLLKTRRLEAKENILNWATQLERYYSEHNTYMGSTINTAHELTDNGWYKLQVTIVEPHYYQITAIPQGIQRQDLCGKFIFDSDGDKNISGEGKVNDCW